MQIEEQLPLEPDYQLTPEQRHHVVIHLAIVTTRRLQKEEAAQRARDQATALLEAFLAGDAIQSGQP